MGIDNSEIKKYMTDDGNIRYSYIQVKKTKGKYQKKRNLLLSISVEEGLCFRSSQGLLIPYELF